MFIAKQPLLARAPWAIIGSGYALPRQGKKIDRPV